MASLNDRLDFVIGSKSAVKLEENLGITTVGELLRYYPRKYSDSMSVRGEGEDLDLEEGEHVTFVDVITKPRPDGPTANRGGSTWWSRWGTGGPR